MVAHPLLAEIDVAVQFADDHQVDRAPRPPGAARMHPPAPANSFAGRRLANSPNSCAGPGSPARAAAPAPARRRPDRRPRRTGSHPPVAPGRVSRAVTDGHAPHRPRRRPPLPRMSGGRSSASSTRASLGNDFGSDAVSGQQGDKRHDVPFRAPPRGPRACPQRRPRASAGRSAFRARPTCRRRDRAAGRGPENVRSSRRHPTIVPQSSAGTSG